MSRPVDVAVGVLVEQREDGPYVLIARRPSKAVLGGYWELPGGKVEPGELLPACLVREFEEELGVQIIVGEALPVVEHAYAHAYVRLHAFFCRRVAGEPRNHEVAEHRWVRPEALVGYRFPPANNPIIEEVRKVLAGQDLS